MQSFMLSVDRLSTLIGKFFAWTVVALTALICWEVFSRYALNKPHAWVLDAHPHKKIHRLGKNAAPLQILDISKGAGQ